MAIIHVPQTDQTITDSQEISAMLDKVGIWYRHHDGQESLEDGATEADVLAAYAEPIEALKAEGGYVTADVIDILPDTPNLQVMLDKFKKEHWHDEDEIRFIVEGSGVFFINPKEGPVLSIEVHKGDMINVPQGTLHWFDLCSDRRIRAIRLFKDPAGWTPRYSDSNVDAQYQSLCFGPAYIP